MASTSEAARRAPPHPLARLPLAALGGGGGFRGDARFGGGGANDRGPVPEPDPAVGAFAEGYAAGFAEARAEAARGADADALARSASDGADADARAGLALAFARLDAALEAGLRERLRDIVAALCERAIAPLALDEAALARRIARVTAMLRRADDMIVIYLNPDDLKLLAASFRADWEVKPDAALERGAIRVETDGGAGVEDGPEQWRRAIDEALAGLPE